MLYAKFTGTNGAELTVSTEIESIAITCRVNEAATIPVSVPTTTMTMLICSTDSFFEGLDNTYKVILSQDSVPSRSLMLYFDVVEVTRLKRKGTVEVACSPTSLGKVDDLYGYMTLPAESKVPWGKVQQMFGLEQVSIQGTLENPVQVYAASKEDLIMGMVWGRRGRYAPTRTPIMDYSMEKTASGVFIFKDVRPVLGASDGAPMYRVNPEDIIDYSIEPAQQTVTHIETRVQGKAKAKNTVLDFAQTMEEQEQMSVMIDTDDQIAAVPSRTYSDEQYTDEKISWSDGVVTQIQRQTTDDRAYILGVIPGYYLQQTSSTDVSLINRETGSAVSSVQLQYMSNVRNQYAVLTKYVDFSDGRHYYLFFDAPEDTTGSGSAVAGIHVKPNMSIAQIELSWSSAGFQPCSYSGSCVVKDGDGEALVAVFSSTAGYFPENVGKIVIDEGSKNNTSFSVVKLAAGSKVGFISDVIADTKDGHVWLMHEDPEFEKKILIERRTTTESSVVAQSTAVNVAMWAYSRQTTSPSVLNTPILAAKGDLNVKYPDPWLMLKLDSSSTQLDVMYAGDLVEWAGDVLSGDIQQVLVTLNHGVVALHIVPTGSTAEARRMYSIGVAPFTTYEAGELGIRTDVDSGLSNPVSFSFKVGPITQITRGSVDKDLGHVEIEVTKFFAIDKLTGSSKVCYPHSLAVPALNSYIVFKLDPRDTALTLGRIAGYKLLYDGQFTSKISAVIVQENFSW